MKNKTTLTVLALALAAPAAFAGSIFITSRGGGGGDLHQYSSTGTLLQSISGNGLVNAQGITIGPNGNLLVINEAGANVLQYNPATGAFIGTFATTNSFPQPIVVGPDGNVYVGADTSVQKFNGTTGAFMGNFTSGNPLSDITGIAFDAAGNLFVGTADSGSIFKYDSTGAFVSTFVSNNPTLSTGMGSLLFNGVNLLVADTFGNSPAWGNQILAFAPNGTQLPDFAGGANLNGPDGMAFGPDGLLYVLNYAGNTVVRYTAAGQFVDTFIANAPSSMRGIVFVNDAGPGPGPSTVPAPGPAPSGVPEPSSVALAAAGLVTVAALRSRKRPQ